MPGFIITVYSRSLTKSKQTAINSQLGKRTKVCLVSDQGNTKLTSSAYIKNSMYLKILF